METSNLERSLGTLEPQAFQRAEAASRIDSISFAPEVRFNGGLGAPAQDVIRDGSKKSQDWAHSSGVQHVAIDQHEGRYALSGGADASIHLWDLEAAGDSSTPLVHKPLDTLHRGDQSHKYGITCLSFYPPDPGLFVSSSYDHHVNVYDTNTLEVSASFDLASKVYSHHMSPIASNVLIATASQHPSIRLVDLRSGSTLHSLVGHNGAVMAVSWSPRDEFVVASAGTDGTLRLWDVRRSASCLGMFDLEDSTGTFGFDGAGTGARNRFAGKAHVGGCNGVAWTEDGDYIVSTGFDERIRVWNVALGANELSHFGPHIRNKNVNTVTPLILPRTQTSPGRRLMFYPNEREIMLFDMFEGTLLKRLKPPGAAVAQGGKAGQRNVATRITSLAWRRDHLELYSSHSDGHIRAWVPHLETEAEPTDEEAIKEEQNEEVARKRKALDEIFQSLTKKPITFR